MKTGVFLVVAAVALVATAGATRSPTPPTLQTDTITVTSTADSGRGSLREALQRASSGTVITFDPTVFPPDNPATVFILSALPELAQGQLTIDGSDAGVILDGSLAPGPQPIAGFMVTSAKNVIQGLQILHFSSGGIILERRAQDNIIGGNRTNGTGPTGQGNVISGNEIGVGINGAEASGNVVSGNYIGTDISGNSAMPNVRGVVITGAAENILGGSEEGEANVISGNEIDGVIIAGAATTGNKVIGNHIGISASGTVPLGNGAAGVWLGEGTHHNIVGGRDPGERNIISGGRDTGVVIDGSFCNTVSGNFIGTDFTGTAPVPNGNLGVYLGEGAQGNLIGGSTTAEGNVISGNESDGVVIGGTATVGNKVSGNFIGTNATGDAAIGNEKDGVWIGEGAEYNVVGGSTPGERNIISGNLNNGVVIDASAHNTISGNYVGTDVSGSEPLGNGNIGLVLAWGAQHNLIGGSTPGERNVISGNSSVGVSIANPGTMSNTVSGNYVGTDITGTKAIGNALIGVHMHDGAQHNVVGGATPGRGNLITGNGMAGVRIEGSDTRANVVTGDYIGTDFSGKADLGNVGDGVHLAGGTRLNIIGPGNTIAYNNEHGVGVLGADTLGNTVTANSIYANGGSGILNGEGGNGELPPPTIIYVSARTVRGIAPSNSRVEIFLDEKNQGRIFQGSTTADAEGNFIFTVPVGTLAGPNVTATAIDGEGNTSQFSAPEPPRAPVVTRELPGIVGPTQVSVEPEVVATNLGLALFCVLFFGLTSNIFNSILKDYRDELVRALARLVPQAARDAISRIGSTLGSVSEEGRGRLLLMWLLLLLLTSLVESFLDPEVGVLSPERLALLMTLFVSALTVSALELGSDLLAHRRWAPTTKAESKLQWAGIAIALACVILSRALDFKPGYLYGIVGAIYLVPKLGGTRGSGKRAALVVMTVLAGGFSLWIATAFLPAVLTELEPLCLTIFLISLQGVFFALIPLAFTDGGDIWTWRKSVWSVFFAVVLFCFYHFALNPNASDVQAVQQNGVQTLLALVVVFGIATLILWVLFPVRLGRAKAAM
jgi:hypothetical protein